ncbi:MAG: aminotransferase class I/II-fold pyridoxal phosphate-dependent enzyme [Ruminococcus sp.]|jgi:histidinol-phosphate aminotransferase|nr:aminotransferase class I/II-fold pyridoxal phosphate-dependent enzyme [Ruminococcus sp.]
MYQLSERLKNLKPYAPADGDYEMRLDANESAFNLSDDILNEVKTAICDINFNRYPDATCEALRTAFADFYEINAKNVVVGNGSDELIQLIVGCMLCEKDTVCLLYPDFSMYRIYCENYGRDYEIFDKSNDSLTFDINELVNFCKTKKITCLLLSNPCNPTSLWLNEFEVCRIIRALPDVLVVVDEAYMDFYDSPVLNKTDEFDNLLILRTASKCVGLPSLRLGFAVSGNKEIITCLNAIRSPYNVGTLPQIIGEIVYKNKFYLRSRRAECIQDVIYLTREFKKLQNDFPNIIEEIFDTRTNFIFIRTNYENQIFEKLKEKSIIVRCFKRHLRITSGNMNENTKLLKVFASILSQL